uniref:FYVE-type domain-containing protein n=1 Tax=Spongospora subterranea TaxID=70186 RepID=A0A0H5QNK1_9EUKA|eukprot:CRZ03157.1 hypothetical protein [Spongospora subterranea]
MEIDPDHLLFESRLSAIISAFQGIRPPGARCLRSYLRKLVKIRAMHCLLRKDMINPEDFRRQMRNYCDLAFLSRTALDEVARSERLRNCLAVASSSERVSGMSGRQLFCLALDQPRILLKAPPFDETALIEDVASYVAFLKEDGTRLDMLSEMGGKILNFDAQENLNLCHPTRVFLNQLTFSRVTPFQCKSISIFQFSDVLIGTYENQAGRLQSDFFIDLFGASVKSVNDFAVRIENVADGDMVVLKTDRSLETQTWLSKFHTSISGLCASRSQWMDDTFFIRCTICIRRFNVSRRKHHCRRCGAVVCHDCSGNFSLLLYNHPSKKKRLCNPCQMVRKYAGRCKVDDLGNEMIGAFLLAIEASDLRKKLLGQLLSEFKTHMSDVGAFRKTDLHYLSDSSLANDIVLNLNNLGNLSSDVTNSISQLLSSWQVQHCENIGALLSSHARFFGEISSYMLDISQIRDIHEYGDLLTSLILPIRQIPTMFNVVSQILEVTPSTHNDFRELSVVARIIGDCSSTATECIARLKGSAVFSEIELRFNTPSSLFSPGRVFLSEGSLTRRMFGRKTYTVFLFSDLFLICKRSPSGLVIRWRIDTSVNPPSIQRFDHSWQLIWSSMCLTFECDNNSQWIQDLQRIAKIARSAVFPIMQPASWVPDNAGNSCALCNKSFSMIVRRHHCRHCGALTCNQCSSNRVPIAGNKNGVNVRFCDKCLPSDIGAIAAPDDDSDVEIEVDDSDSDEMPPMSMVKSFIDADENWMNDGDSKNCLICDRQFGIGRRKHHCRECGGLVCKSCSKSRLIVEKTNRSSPVRVCDRCSSEVHLPWG